MTTGCSRRRSLRWAHRQRWGLTHSANGFSLTPEEPVATLDYNFEVAGLPYFVVSGVWGGHVDVEVNWSDGDVHAEPTWSALQTLRLLSGDSVTFEAVGLQASIKVTDDMSTLPGKFSSSNPKYNEIWDLGARAVSAAHIDAGSQVSSWSSSPENGTFVPGTRPGVSYKTWNLSDNTLEFESQIIRGGVGFYVGYDITANRGSLMFHVSSEYPTDSTYANINTTLFPANIVTLAYGFDFVNASTMTSYTLGNLVLWLDGYHVLDVTISELGFSESQLSSLGYSTTGAGAIRFGGCKIKHLLYAIKILPEYGVQSNTHGACLDGAKRDRYIWLGDFYHTTRIMGVANSKPEQIAGTWEYLFNFNYQASNGQFPGLMGMTYETPMPTPEVFTFNAGTANAYLNFPDYDVLGLIGFVSLVASCQTSDGLIDVTKYVNVFVFLGSGSGTAVNAAAVQCLEGMARVAQSVGDEGSASEWLDVAASVKTAINELLWNDTLGNYMVDVSSPEVYGVAAIAFAITSGVANNTQADLCVKSLANLRQGPGYLDTSDTDNTTKISPNTNRFLLNALLQTGHVDEAAFLLDNLWDAMISNELYRSGASWEYVSQSLEPGLQEFTSLSHPWGGAPTYTLTNYVAGIRPSEFEFRRCIVNPLMTGLDITITNATVNTPYGALTAAWEIIHGDVLRVMISAPVGTEGTFEVTQLNSTIFQRSVNGTREPTFFSVQL
ncbi:unnamed protein product [Phytophthora lilii]|uniref:Unnamed protein product n=1 Tax=Phytophthora lilii TaxID=2077276 RepID=A0A9W6XBJ2_9STRA|nr:unnamed protein product [Phytophthora lilii]